MLKCLQLGVSTALKVGKAPLGQIYRIKELSVFVVRHNGHPGSNPRYAERWARAKYKTSENVFIQPCNQSYLGKKKKQFVQHKMCVQFKQYS